MTLEEAKLKLRDLIVDLQKENPELSIELTKVISVDKGEGPPLIVRLDFPIIGYAVSDNDLCLVIGSALEMIAFGKDIRRFDGTPATKEDVTKS